ncbi:MAG: hypothetical protein J6K03_00100 [Oscillospiraceae bacterium]|nr:hypothetical protein [Oscillospiraceae bacterium]
MQDYRKLASSKSMVWILLAALLITSMIFPVSAANTYAEIPQSIRNEAQSLLADPEASILRIHNEAIFTDHTGRSKAYYIAIAKDGSSVGLRETESGIDQLYISLNSKVLDFFVSDKIMDYMDEGAKIADIYCLDGSAYNQGTVIWYIIDYNKAIYRFVYFYHPQIGEFLFPQNEFEAYRKSVIQDPQMRLGLYDLAPYDLNSDHFYLNLTGSRENTTPTIHLVLISVGSMVLIGLIVIILTWLYKRRAHHLEDSVVPLDLVCPPPGVPVMDPGDEIGVLNRP